LAGRLPYSGKSSAAVLASLERAPAHPLRKAISSRRSGSAGRRDIPRDLETIVGKAMEIDRARRYPTADQLPGGLDAPLVPRPIRARPPAWHERAFRVARRHRILLMAVSLVAVLAAVGAILAVNRVRAQLEAPARFAEHVKQARLALMDPGFRVTAFF